MKTSLFTYGKLQPGMSPPSSMTESHPDQAWGKLFDFGNDAHAINLENHHGSDYLFNGHTMSIDHSELPKLDAIEEPAGFKRVPIMTKNGKKAWAYDYRKPVPNDLKPISSWPPSGAKPLT